MDNYKLAFSSLNFIIDSLYDVVYMLNPDGLIVYINKAVERYGFKKTDLIGKSVLELIHDEDIEDLKYRLTERRRGERSTNSINLRFKGNDNKIVYFHSIGKGITVDLQLLLDSEGIYNNDTGKPEVFEGTIGILRDVTEKIAYEKIIKSSEEKYKSIFNFANDAIFFWKIVDEEKLELTFVDSNKKANSLTGYTKQELKDKSPYDIWSKKSKDNFPEIFGELIKKGKLIAEVEFQHKNGTIISTDISSGIVEINGMKTVISIVRDLTEEKINIDKIQKLENIIPICALCKNVRDDKGFWESVEEYIMKYSNNKIDFSHGICPDCKERLYPDLN